MSIIQTVSTVTAFNINCSAKVVDFFGNTGNMIYFFFVIANIITGFFVGVVFFVN